MIECDLIDWAAYAPGIATREQWLAWAQAPFLPQGDETPALAELPPLMRRRIDRLGRVAIQALAWCREAETSGVPVVFASRHGDVARSQQLLESLAASEPMSPAGFGLSVHNAIAALHAIACGERGNYTAIAGGSETAEAALGEAAAMLHDGAEQVLLVVYDAVLPAVHVPFLDEPDPCYAWAWRIAPTGRGGTRLSLAPAADLEPATVVPALPHGLDVLRFVLAGESVLGHRARAAGWRWRRHA